MPEEGLTLTPITAASALPGAEEAGAFADAIATLRDTAPPPPWCSYLAIEAGRAVALGGFKGPPSADAGEVEIGYLTFASHEGRGLAKALAARLVALAAAHGARVVSAHTLPASNASTAVLVATGFVRDGWGEDGDVGPVWRWIRAL